jgi:branched-subunit amino acid ABC-type transport system permease component
MAGIVGALGGAASYWGVQFFNGLVFGMILVLVSIGLSIVFGLMGIVNFAHGELLLLGAYGAWAATQATGNIILGFIGAIGLVMVLSMLIERLLLRSTYDRDPLVQLLLTFGLAEIIRGGVKVIWGGSGKIFEIPAWGLDRVDLLLFEYPAYRLFVVIVSTALVVGVYLFLTRTDYGLLISAGAHDREMLQVMGINEKSIFFIVFVIGGSLAGIAGGLIAPIQAVTPQLGIEFLVPAFVVVVIGGLGSFKGSVVSGIAVGETIVLTGILDSTLSGIIIYILMAITLLIRPKGLFGQQEVF